MMKTVDRYPVRLRAVQQHCGIQPPWIDDPELTVADYAKTLWIRGNAPASSDAHLSRALLSRALGRAAAAVMTEEQQACLLREFDEYPVIQTADHLQLLMDKSTYCNNLLFSIGAQSRGLRHFIGNASSSNTLRATRETGPGLLRVGSTLLNVFGLSTSRLSRTCVAAKDCVVSFALRPMGAASPEDELDIEFVRARLEGDTYRSPSEAFLAGNRILWRALNPGGDAVTPLFTDDWLASDLVCAHLGEADSPVSRLFSNRAALSHLLELRGSARSFIERKALPFSTCLFWGIGDDGRRVPLRLVDGDFVEPGGRALVACHSGALEEHLRARRILPDLFLGFLVLSILPGTRVVGGFSQAIYLNSIRRTYADVAMRYLSPEPCASGDWDLASNGLVHGLIEAVFRDGVPVGDMRAVATSLGRMPLRVAVGGLEAADYLTRWAP